MMSSISVGCSARWAAWHGLSGVQCSHAKPVQTKDGFHAPRQAFRTDFSGGVVRDNPAVNKIVSDMTALGRPGLPEDIGGIIALLLSDDNHWINTQRIKASGGMRL